MEVPVLRDTSAPGVFLTHTSVPRPALKAAALMRPLSTLSVFLIYFPEAPAKILGC